ASGRRRYDEIHFRRLREAQSAESIAGLPRRYTDQRIGRCKMGYTIRRGTPFWRFSLMTLSSHLVCRRMKTLYALLLFSTTAQAQNVTPNVRYTDPAEQRQVLDI